MKVTFKLIHHVLKFRFKAGTSRGSFTEKPTWYIIASDDEGREGIGEASPLPGLSIDFDEQYEIRLTNELQNLEKIDLPETSDELLNTLKKTVSQELPSVHFGIETALLDLLSPEERCIVPGDFHQGSYRMPINGLIWMGDEGFMQEQIDEKLEAGFDTIKMKIGAIEINKELALLEKIRTMYSSNDITLRVDANGAFDESNVREVLTELAALQVHSIEQPVKKGSIELMRTLCEEEILPIALDEELIGVMGTDEKRALLSSIQPQYIILKPSLIGGILHTKEWIEIAESLQIGWWMTSMLESNVGLNAIAQLTASYKPKLPQGLGTGQLYHNNIDSPLEIRKGHLLYNKPKVWDQLSDLS